MTITKLVMCEDLYNVLKDKIHIPDGVTELIITLRAGSPVMVTFTKFAEKPVNISDCGGAHHHRYAGGFGE